MKSILFSLCLLILPLLCFSQQYGNAGYGNGSVTNTSNDQIKSTKAPVQYQSANSVTIEVSGIYNLDSDGYIAIFAAAQSGKTAEETDNLMNVQIKQIKSGMNSSGMKADIFVDMVSFIPLYEYETEKKVFSKKTYKEVPSGFELKKNIHIRYQDPALLEKIITICSKAEVYDLVKVDHYSEKLEQFKDEMRQKAVTILNKKIQFNKDILNVDLKTKKRTMGEGFLMFYPIEQYSSYQAYCNTSINPQQNSKVQNVQKATTYYYNPVFPKAHDFIINSDKLEPSMQMLYTLSVTYDLRTTDEIAKQNNPPVTTPNQPKKEYILITANGQIKTLPIE